MINSKACCYSENITMVTFWGFLRQSRSAVELTKQLFSTHPEEIPFQLLITVICCVTSQLWRVALLLDSVCSSAPGICLLELVIRESHNTISTLLSQGGQHRPDKSMCFCPVPSFCLYSTSFSVSPAGNCHQVREPSTNTGPVPVW